MLLHCAAGKDRTGLVVALLLEVAGVPRQRILDDYVRSARALPASYRERGNPELSGALGNSDEFATALHLDLDSPAVALDAALDMVEARFASAAAICWPSGWHRGELAILREELAGPGAAEEAGPDLCLRRVLAQARVRGDLLRLELIYRLPSSHPLVRKQGCSDRLLVHSSSAFTRASWASL